ncbi:MAG: hypothetical protein ACRDNP_09080 [Gaiellaceae bacterium]
MGRTDEATGAWWETYPQEYWDVVDHARFAVDTRGMDKSKLKVARLPTKHPDLMTPYEKRWLGVYPRS